MMIDKRLIGTVPESKKYIVRNVILQWFSLIANIVMMTVITSLLAKLFYRTADAKDILITLMIAVVTVIVRYVCTAWASKMGYLSSKEVKKTLREMIYKKLLNLGTSYNEKIKTSEIVQLAVEGVDQLETCFCRLSGFETTGRIDGLQKSSCSYCCFQNTGVNRCKDLV